MLKKFELEYELGTSPRVLFPFLSTEIGLSEWFADQVRIDGNIYHFSIDGEDRKAEAKEYNENYHIKYAWINCPEKSYLDFLIKIDDLTGELILVITDFAEESEIEEIKTIWNSQVSNLKHQIGL